NKAENVLVMKDTRSKILFRVVDDFERLRGSNLAWFGLDELTYTQEEAWLRLEGRLRDPKAKVRCGFAVWTPELRATTGFTGSSSGTEFAGTRRSSPSRGKSPSAGADSGLLHAAEGQLRCEVIRAGGPGRVSQPGSTARSTGRCM